MTTESNPTTQPEQLAVEDARPRLALRPVMLAALLSASGAGWMVGGLFRGILARLICVGAVALGVGVVAGSFRTARPAVLHYLLAPIALVAAAAVSVPVAQGATLPDSIVAAISNGGLLQPPVAFDAGWRFLAVLLLASVGGATALLTATTGKPRLSLMVPLPLVAAAALIQPADGQLIGGIVALLSVIGALMVLSNAELGADTTMSRGFVLRRNARGGGALVGLVVALFVLNQTNVLFPEPVRARTAEPQRPKIVSLSQIKDRPLFTVQGESKGPWREGVLDVYKDNAFLLPPYDPSSFKVLDHAGALETQKATTRTVQFTMQQAGTHTLPTPGGPASVDFSGPRLSFDPASETLRVVDGVAPQGFRYSVTAVAPPDGSQLDAAGAPPRSVGRELLAPAVPVQVQAVLDKAPTNAWERLQFVRARFYEKVVAAGAGQPIDVPPARVAQMLNGGQGTPFEITAGEVLLARWSGIPARMAFGYYGGQKVSSGYEIRPRDGANWLEVYFSGYGWVPVFGTPPQARATLNQNDKNRNVQVRPSDDISAEIYIPFTLENPTYLYEVIRYWVAVATPVILALIMLAFLYPFPLKLLRRRSRRRWAGARGIAAQVAVEYAEFRDAATDLNTGNRQDTPLEFLDRIDDDAEHEELAWLTTRALWGDLARDLHPEDAEAARELSESVRRRLAKAQTPVTRFLALGSRASLREPFDRDLPNPWGKSRKARKPGRRGAVLGRAFAAATLFMGGLAGCGQQATAQQPNALPSGIVPASIAQFTTREEPAAEKLLKSPDPHAEVDKGLVYSLSRDGVVQGLVQVGVFKPDVKDTKIRVRHQVRSGVGNGHFKFYKVGGIWVGEQARADLRVFMWFPEGEHTYELLTLRNEVADYADVVVAVIAYGRGGSR
ncbi:MAG: hypothetical protein NVS3B24_06580 [Candidatus Dormibacteria bacterium]